MTRTLILVVCLALALLLLPGFAPERSRAGPFEYKFVRIGQGLMESGPFAEVPLGDLGEEVANSLAREGWTLDQVETLWIGAPNSQFEAMTLVFRRPR